MPIFDLITEAFLGKVKTVLIILSTVIAIFSSGYGFYMKVKYEKENREKENLETRNTVLTTENITYLNELGQTVSTTRQYEVTIEQLSQSNDSLEQAIYKKIKASDNKPKNVKEATVVEMSVKSSGMVTHDTIFIHDTLATDTVPIIKYDDGYLDFTITNDTVDYTYDDTFYAFKVNELAPRKFFLWKILGLKKKTGRNKVEIVMENPNAKTKVRTIEIRKK